MKHARRWVLLALVPVLVAACGVRDTAAEPSTRPERIVSLSSTATEILFEIGAGDRVVAVDAQSDYPPGVPTTELSALDPNLEAISAYQPELVVTALDDDGLTAGLDAIGVLMLLQPPAVTLQDTYTQIEQLGAATGQVAEAEALVARLREEIDRIVAGVPDRPRPLTYYHELDADYYTVTRATFIGEMYAVLGMRSIADEAGGGVPYPQLSAEFILDTDPDVILLADAECCGVDAAAVAARPGWDRLTAVREGRIIELDEDLASRWGPRVVDLLRTLAGELAAVAPVEPVG